MSIKAQQQKLTRLELKTLFITVLMASCGMLAIDIHLPSMPYIMSVLHTDAAHMQQSISGFLLGVGASLLFYGPVSDAYGRKPVVIVGLSIAAVSSFLCAYSDTIDLFLLCRVFQGIGSGVCMGLGRTIAIDILRANRFSTIGSYFSLFLSLSPLLAPMLGGYIQQWLGWRANFLILAAMIALILLLFAFFCPETNTHRKQLSFQRIAYDYQSLMLNKIFVCFTLISGIGMAANMAYATSSSFILQMQYHLTPITYGWVTAAVGAASIVGKILGPSLIKKIHIDNTLFLGLMLILMSGVIMVSFILTTELTVMTFMLIVMLCMLGQIFAMPIAAGYAIGPFHDKRGTASALFGGFQLFIAFICTAIMGLLASYGANVLALAYLVLGLLGILVYTVFIVPAKDRAFSVQ